MQYDIVIIGSGGAGLSAALRAKEEGVSILVIGEGYPTRSQTSMAQGGINAALGNVTPDSPQQHADDTLKASKGLASERMVEKLCNSAGDTIRWLDSIGVPFSRIAHGKIAQRQMGGASAKRACYSQDYTGLKILHTLYDQCLKEDIEFLNEHFLLELSTDQGRINGVIVYDIRNGEPIAITAKSVILATGGYSALYHGYTTNTNQSTGDGLAAAAKAGATLSNMEFIQFHPTALKGSGVLISESARGAGGKLVNSKGTQFVDELKPRDVVSRAIWEEIQKGESLFLDIRHLGENFIDENIPQERKLCITYAGVDPVHDLIPIMPVAHYSMGGIDVDSKMMSNIEGLFAIGECSNAHVHGANRLGGNSLLEIVSFGYEAGMHAARFAQNTQPLTTAPSLEKQLNYLEHLKTSEPEINFYTQRERLGNHCYLHAGIIRNGQDLQQTLTTVHQMQKELPQMGLMDKGEIYNTNLIERIKFENSLLLASAMLQSALKREESRGAHYRDDFPQSNPAFEKESISMLVDQKFEIAFREVEV